ncbi:MAG TPA: glycosyltransferase family 9 protein [Caulobacterales bacterium]|nr:glycosyltransferase family 9 protein [Caulobacterales bacterium]
MRSLLFIAPADLGEAVLAGAALNAMLTPETTLDLACDARLAPLFRAAPGLRAVHHLDGGGFRGWLKLARDLAEAHFDVALDLSRRRLGLAVRADRRIVRGSPRVLRHLIEEFADLIGVERLAPHVWLDDAARSAAPPEKGPLLALAPGPAPAAEWPAERFAATARRLVGGAGPLAGGRVAILGAAMDSARAIASSLDADGVPARNLAGRLDILAEAAVLERVTLCLGSDVALMHAASAVGAPVLGLFGASDERIVGPYGARTRALRGRTYEDIMSGAVAGNGLDALSVDVVENASLDLLRGGGLQ